jgi:hypothetical protein
MQYEDSKSQTRRIVSVGETIRDNLRSWIQSRIAIGTYRDKEQIVLKFQGYSAPG